jgi:hypothetical protein
MNLIDTNLVGIEHENGNRLLPKIFIEDLVFEELCYTYHWQDSLIIYKTAR